MSRLNQYLKESKEDPMHKIQKPTPEEMDASPSKGFKYKESMVVDYILNLAPDADERRLLSLFHKHLDKNIVEDMYDTIDEEGGFDED